MLAVDLPLASTCFLLWLVVCCGIAAVWFSLGLWVALFNSVDLSFSFFVCVYMFVAWFCSGLLLLGGLIVIVYWLLVCWVVWVAVLVFAVV